MRARVRLYRDMCRGVPCAVGHGLAHRDLCPLRSESDRSAALPRSVAMCQDQTSHTDKVGRLRETTLRRSPLRYASDWRQDIDTAPAALRMTSSTTSGFDNMGTCEDATSVVSFRNTTLAAAAN